MLIDYVVLIVITLILFAIYCIEKLKEIEEGMRMLLRLREMEVVATIKEAEG